ncbi:hypothetical protein [Streptomyces sp. NPDC057740]|uniref:hypothetical protein n=1 Tax=Streptomyces sp. NPDC057740 TaxID=3346234 RepID=UPI0036C7E74D
MPPGTRTDPLPAVPGRRTTPSWARPDPLDELAERLDDFIAAAVHPDEIAALLESDGLSDDQIRERYGLKDSFALAEELYERVERRHPEPAGPAHDPWRTGLLACLLRGVVFALPGLGYVLGAPFLTGPRDDFDLPAGTVPLLVGALVGWTWNQGLAHRAYSWLGLGDRRSARRALLLGAPSGALLGTLLPLAVAGTAHPSALAFTAGQSIYLAAATVLLVLGRERALLAALLPMAAGAAVTPVHPLPDTARLTLLLGSLAVVALLGLREVALPKGRGELRDQPRRTRSRQTTTGPPLPGSLPYAVFGLATGTLVLHAALEDALAAVALTLSMGPAEWLLYRFRSASLTGLRSSGTPRAFRHTTARTLTECLAAYLTALLALTLPTGITGMHLAGLLLLGVVLWTGLLLQSFGAVLGTTTICCVAALAQTVALVTHTGSPHWIALTVHASAGVAQTVLVCALLGRVTAHR